MVYIATVLDLEGQQHDDFNRMCRELFWEVEQKLVMHKLAKQYYGFRVFWVQSIPLLLITTFITIIGFTQYGNYSNHSFGWVDKKEYNDLMQLLALSVGTMGLLSIILSILMMHTRYQSKRDMHAMAERTLAKVCQSVQFPERQHRDDGTKLIAHIEKQNAIYMSVLCISSTIPPKIAQAFNELEHIMGMKQYTFRAIQYERLYSMLWKSFTKRLLWPFLIPDICISTSVLGKLIEEEYVKYNKGLEEATKRNNIIVRRRSTGRSCESSRSSENDEEQPLVSSSTVSTTIAEEV